MNMEIKTIFKTNTFINISIYIQQLFQKNEVMNFKIQSKVKTTFNYKWWKINMTACLPSLVRAKPASI